MQVTKTVPTDLDLARQLFRVAWHAKREHQGAPSRSARIIGQSVRFDQSHSNKLSIFYASMPTFAVQPSRARDGTRPAAPADAVTGTLTTVEGKESPPRRGQFLALYGWTGLLMIAMFLLSALWLAMLAVIQQAPTWVANVLMDTADLDDGDLWIFTRADEAIAFSSTVFLGGIALTYVWLIGVMVRQSCVVVVSPAITESRVHPTPVTHRLRRIPSTREDAKLIRSKIKAFLIQTRLHDSPLQTLPKLVLQTVTLIDMLAEGIPPTITLTYSSLLMINWLISCYRHSGQRQDVKLVKSRIFFSFDTFFAVFAPLQVLMYACSNFQFDRAEFATRVDTLSPGSFDRIARLFVDPTQISLFRIAFQSLQLTTWPSLLLKVVLNVFTVLRWHRIVVDLGRKTSHGPIGSSKGRVGRLARGALFLCTGLAIFAYTIVAIVSTTQSCRAYEHCKVPSYQWSVGETSCACTVFVDHATTFKSLAEWQNPVDTSNNLAKLAAAGRLKVVQIINRRLPALPDQLRGCRDLEHLVLFYTLTTAVPNWASGFSKLKYLHIEGISTDDPLTHLPADFFAHMPFLVTMHLGDLGRLAAVPDLSHLVRLKYLVLALLQCVTELPGLDALRSLEQFTLLSANRLQYLPPLSALTKLTTAVFFGRSSFCCNGFLPGQCDLHDPLCSNRSVCSTITISPTDLNHVAAQIASACQPPSMMSIDFARPTVVTTDLACGGTAFKQCEVFGMPGICYPARMQLVLCDLDRSISAMRRLQIQRGVGVPCDPVVEKWLGCSETAPGTRILK